MLKVDVPTKLRPIAFALLAALIAPVAAQADAGDAQISSDGYVVKQGALSATESSSSGTLESASSIGAGRPLRVGEVDDAAANLPARTESATEVWKLWSAKPMQAAVGSESIIGADTRTRINPTTTFPARATVLITFDVPGGSARCSGWMISPNTVATAGHCLHQGFGGATGFYPTASYRIYPGRNGATSPYGSCTAKRLSTTTGWANNMLDNYDYGAIKLNCSIGNTVGWYGYFYTLVTNINGIPTTITGYPGDQPLTQWRSQDKVRVTFPTRLFYQNDTVGGMSGSPVWFNRSASCPACVIAIHAYGVYGDWPYSANNHGTRITWAVWRNLTNWKNAP